MQYKSFRVQNFKGIKDASISLENISGASVFALVGLNESGKTTLLEAIHSFSPDAATSELLGGEEKTGIPFKERVPRHQLSSFTGCVSVTATLALTDEDIESIASQLREVEKLDLSIQDLPSEVKLERSQKFENGDFIVDYFNLLTPVLVKGVNQRRWRIPSVEEIMLVRDAIFSEAPDIAYFPSFVFDFPEKVFLTDRGSRVDQFYRTAFQDILDYDGRGYSIERDIIKRVRGKDLVVPWTTFLAAWLQRDDRDKIQHVMDRAGAAVTRLVFGRWNRIFGEDTRGKEVVISFDTVEGEVVDAAGTVRKTQEHDVYITFQIRDGTRRFKVNDRSLGFRWFFAFMLFTQFRVARTESRPMLFLFDEPASNLHAAAQQKLIDCFPEIARDDHMLIYSTHSHYMIEPKWLEQTFIVTNRADAPEGNILDDVSLDDESLDIQAATYRSFVDAHPTQTSYFQPILDRLEVVPSRFDMKRASVVVEGKSDYYILRYASCLAAVDAELPIIPAVGAGTFGALAGLHVGWNLNFLFVLDGDRQGQVERKRYVDDFGIEAARIVIISDLVKDTVFIEDLLDSAALEVVRDQLSIEQQPSKAQIRRFFQERLAMNKIEELSPGFAKKARSIISALEMHLSKGG